LAFVFEAFRFCTLQRCAKAKKINLSQLQHARKEMDARNTHRCYRLWFRRT
jgi:hypothetical protein